MDGIDYGRRMHDALRDLVRSVLGDVAENGLPGKHHFFITFDSAHPGVDMAPWLLERYPSEMTIVMQDWFENLAVMEDRFTVTLNFGNNPEPLVIPFDAIRTFVDPSVEFGLRFDSHEVDEDEDAPEAPMSEDEEPETPDDDGGGAEILSLDKFRK
ncbi:SspB family protein [Paracoccaceae bacterium GXU_MW_L88]